MSENRPNYLAGIYLFLKMNTTILPRRSEFLANISCEYKNELLLYPYAFRTHTHSMGRVVSAYVKQDQNWTLIGKSNPQWSQVITIDIFFKFFRIFQFFDFFNFLKFFPIF